MRRASSSAWARGRVTITRISRSRYEREELAAERDGIVAGAALDPRAVLVCVEPALAALAQPRVDVPAQRLDRERRLEREKLCAPPHRRRPNPHPGPDLVRAAERVARVFARRVRADEETLRIRRGHVLRGVDG